MSRVYVERVKIVPKKDKSGNFGIVTINGKEMYCFDGNPRAFEGKDGEAEIEERAGKFYAKFSGDPMPHEGAVPPPTPAPVDKGKPSFGGGKPFGRSPDDLALTAKTMSASYAKDLVVAWMNAPADAPKWEDVIESFLDAYAVVYAVVSGTKARPNSEDPQRVDAPPPPTDKDVPPVKEEDPPAKKEAPVPPPVKVSKLVKPEEVPPQEQSDEIVCGGKNAKLKGRKVKMSFCKKCHFLADCDLRVGIPLE